MNWIRMVVLALAVLAMGSGAGAQRTQVTTRQIQGLRDTIGAVISDSLVIGEGIQAWDADLDGLSALSGTGFAVRTASNTWAQRAIGGTTDRISVSNGDGISGAPSIDIASTYAGQTSITTLGTIGTGTWQATDVGVAHGGTGASDASGARTNLGLAIGSNVQAYDADLDALAASGSTGSGAFVRTTTPTINSTSITGTPYHTGNLSPVTTSTSFSGDVTGAYNATVVGNDSHSHGIGTLSGVQASDADLTAIAGLSSADGNFIVGSATGWVAESGATARSSLGLAIGTNVQAYSANLTDLATYGASVSASANTYVKRDASGYITNTYFNTTANVTATAASHFAIQQGSDNYIRWQTPANARTSLGLGSLATLSSINNGNWSGTDLAVANGGTGASDASGARTNLGLVIGTNVQAYDADLAALASSSSTGSGAFVRTTSPTINSTSITGTPYHSGNLSPLTTSTNHSGDVSGAYNAMVVADDSHNHGASTISGTSAATASTVVERDASARFQAADPSASADVATKNYVDTQVASAGGGRLKIVTSSSASSASITCDCGSGWSIIQGAFADGGSESACQNLVIHQVQGLDASVIAVSGGARTVAWGYLGAQSYTESGGANPRACAVLCAEN